MRRPRKSARTAATTSAGGSFRGPTGTVAAACSAAMNASRSARAASVSPPAMNNSSNWSMIRTRRFAANAAWLSIAAAAHNLLRAAGALASLPYAKARAATIRRDLISVAARTARRGRGHLTLHLPEGWHREQGWRNLWDAACGPPATAA